MAFTYQTDLDDDIIKDENFRKYYLKLNFEDEEEPSGLFEDSYNILQHNIRSCKDYCDPSSSYTKRLDALSDKISDLYVNIILFGHNENINGFSEFIRNMNSAISYFQEKKDNDTRYNQYAKKKRAGKNISHDRIKRLEEFTNQYISNDNENRNFVFKTKQELFKDVLNELQATSDRISKDQQKIWDLMKSIISRIQNLENESHSNDDIVRLIRTIEAVNLAILATSDGSVQKKNGTHINKETALNQLRCIEQEIPGKKSSGWNNLRNSLIILGGVLAICGGIALIVATFGTGSVFGVGLSSLGIGLLSGSGASFFGAGAIGIGNRRKGLSKEIRGLKNELESEDNLQLNANLYQP